MWRTLLIVLLSLSLATAKEKKSEFQKASEKAAKRKRPLILIAAPQKGEFFKKVKELLQTKEGKRAISGSEVAFLCTKCDEDDKETAERLNRLKLAPNDEALVVCDYQMVVVRRFGRVPKVEELADAVKEAKKICKRKKKVMRNIEKLFKKASAAYKKKDYKTAGMYCAKIRRIKEDYEKKHPDDNLRSRVFDVMKRWAEEVRQKVLKIVQESQMRLVENRDPAGALAKLNEAEQFKGFDPELDRMIDLQRSAIEKELQGQKR